MVNIERTVNGTMRHTLKKRLLDLELLFRFFRHTAASRGPFGKLFGTNSLAQTLGHKPFGTNITDCLPSYYLSTSTFGSRLLCAEDLIDSSSIIRNLTPASLAQQSSITMTEWSKFPLLSLNYEIL